MKEHNINNTQIHDTRYNVVHPQCRGYVHRTVFYSTLYKKTIVLICTLSCRSSSVFKPCTQLQASAHTATYFLNHPKPSAHIAAKVVHTHSWDLTFLTNKPYLRINSSYIKILN